ncbi:N-acetylglucosamine-6-phosphate deacetylase [Labedella populi]|uniref:N-acetylglucosamine-6-phosphate deacetylase n=1 Tax=Labedella populi TaxID=2498850 RepID=A0A444QCL8_9MICO|nr:amidohydrolase family protein [Labedella populi]RWZ64443.1 N-acetylglucosamine-6-phosphate deacetylase [Labedella populi]
MRDATIIHSARLIDAGRETLDAWVLLADGVVLERGTGTSWERLVGGDDGTRVVDATGGVLTPGFIDLHGHGGGGASFDDGPDAVRTALATHRAHGTTRSVISLVSTPVDRLVENLAIVARLADEDPTVLGAHLEGPFLSPDNRGAHDPAALTTPTASDVERLVTAGRGRLVQITIAPELPGALEAIRAFRRAGVVVAIGHTVSDFAGAAEAFAAGATLLTHAFNAMPGIHHRSPGPIVAAMSEPSVVLELIADGVHVDPAVLALAFAGAPGRIALVTDAMAAAGFGDGAYELGGLAVSVDRGVARLTDSGVIAGSTLTQDAALSTVVTAGVPLADGVRALTETPARVVGRPELGSLGVGAVADAVLFRDGLDVSEVWIGGASLG